MFVPCASKQASKRAGEQASKRASEQMSEEASKQANKQHKERQGKEDKTTRDEKATKKDAIIEVNKHEAMTQSNKQDKFCLQGNKWCHLRLARL